MWFRKDKPTVLEPIQPPESVPVAVSMDPAGWLSVGVALPEYDVRVLVHHREHGVLTGHRVSQSGQGDTWTLGLIERGPYCKYPSQVRTSGVTHWRAMPSPPAIPPVSKVEKRKEKRS